MLVRLQPKIHWTPEICGKWGKDYGRGFLDSEGVVDIAEVCTQYTLRELTHAKHEATSLEVADELRRRLADACCYHHINIDEADTEVQFLKPQY